MKNIISAYGTVIVILCNLLICIQLVNASGQTMAAQEYKAAVVAEVENSNFNPNVISMLKNQAITSGYELEIRTSSYDTKYDVQAAEIILKYTYSLPLFGINEVRQTRGIAR